MLQGLIKFFRKYIPSFKPEFKFYSLFYGLWQQSGTVSGWQPVSKPTLGAGRQPRHRPFVLVLCPCPQGLHSFVHCWQDCALLWHGCLMSQWASLCAGPCPQACWGTWPAPLWHGCPVGPAPATLCECLVLRWGKHFAFNESQLLLLPI